MQEPQSGDKDRWIAVLSRFATRLGSRETLKYPRQRFYSRSAKGQPHFSEVTGRRHRAACALYRGGAHSPYLSYAR